VIGVGAEQRRMLVVAAAVAGLFLLIVARAAEVAILRGPELALAAAGQHGKRIALPPRRGPIVDRHGEVLALSVDVPSVYARPREFAGQEVRVPQLATVLGLPAAAVRTRVATRSSFVWLKRQALPREAEAALALGLRGVGVEREARRFYPHHELGAHVLGMVDVDSRGLGGIELRLDGRIRGTPRAMVADRDAKGREMFLGGVQGPPDDGDRVELTLDAAIQDAVERELAAGVERARAVGGTAVVLDPRTGELLALANVPSYDPNHPDGRQDRRWRERLRNRAVTEPFEPGSTFKGMLAAAALEERVVAPAEMFFCENGALRVGRWTINDSHPHGWLSFAEVIQVSSNIGVTKVAQRLGRERYHRYLEAFGFGRRTGIELPGESPGILRPADKWAQVDLAVHAFGQGVSVTPVQMAAAYGAIANGGVLMRPFVVRRVVSPTGALVAETAPAAVRRVLSEKTARTVTELLRRVVEEKTGTGTRARLEDFPVAGKTGTAQKVNLQIGGYSSKRIGSFVGFVPADRPRAVIFVAIDEPSTSSYGGVVAAPVFRAIAAAAMQRLGVEPTPEPAVQLAGTPRRGVSAAAPPAPEPEPAPARAAATLAAASARDVVPDLRGLSLREAWARARAAGLDVDIRGSGWVRTQEPAPGTPLAGERRLALGLARDRGTASP
jgi:cell division protein FtsI (penicillin-binding protein 3)